MAVVVVDREQLRQLKRLLASLPDKGDEDAVEEPSSIPWATRKAHQEMQAIEEALQNTNGNITRAAELLGMHRTTLWRKLKRYREGK